MKTIEQIVSQHESNTLDGRDLLRQIAGATSTTTVNELREVVEAAVSRGEYDLAVALIDVLKRFS